MNNPNLLNGLYPQNEKSSEYLKFQGFLLVGETGLAACGHLTPSQYLVVYFSIVIWAMATYVATRIQLSLLLITFSLLLLLK